LKTEKLKGSPIVPVVIAYKCITGYFDKRHCLSA